ncbi:putative amidohydrolase [Propionicimonas paludicola]|uniref:Putative amidohydrolase n=1 Tax=Propionicimonas paludicola TaxID=185243 RepID=A0A2A9CXY9_9ACTN|nr:carbon-nitrogen hydrolase family protein [Propionicimonas paludicola]PFG18439.1 putative amidohydrolase [Propionicimonas paludicola]
MRVALAQLRSGTDPSQNLDLVADHIARAAGRAELLVFPEATMSSFAGAAHRAAQPLDGPWAGQVRQLAVEADLTVVLGMFTPGAGRARNTLLVTGAAETHYDKLHLFDAFGQAESDDIEPGAALASFSLGTHQVGLATCYDVRFPTLFTSLARGGAELIVLPASWASGPGKLHQWRTLVTARAMDSTSFVVAVDQAAGPDARPGLATGIGHSMVVSPTGEVLLELGDDPELAFIDLDLAEVPAVRLRLPVLAHTRPLP